MTTHVDKCLAEAQEAGWSGATLRQIVIDPKSESTTGFRARLAEANNIRALINIVGPSMKALGYDTEGALQDFIAKGVSYDEVRKDTARVMAEADDAIVIDSTQRKKGATDPYMARAAEIDAHKVKTP